MPEKLLFKRLAIVFGLLTAVTGIAAILMTRFSVTSLGIASLDNRTMAFSAALLWIFLGSVLAYQNAKPFSRIAGLGVQVVLVLIAVTETTEFIFSIGGSHFFIETLFVKAGTAIIGPSSAPISPVAAIFAAFVAIALIIAIRNSSPSAKPGRVPDTISILGLAITFSSFTFILSYAYGSPLLYGTQYMPLAVGSAIAGLFIGTALVASAGPGAIPVRYVIGETTSARLLRIFVPLVIGIILLQNFAFVDLPSWFSIKNPILLSATLVVFALATAYVVARIAGGMGTELEQAEQEIVRKNEDLNALNEELTATQEELRQTNDDLLVHERHLTQKNTDLNALNEELTATQEELRQTNDALLTNERQLVEKNKKLETSQQELRTSEERFRSLVDGAKDYAIFALDPSGTIFSWNDGATRIKGYRAEEIIGKNFSVFYIPDDVQKGKPEKELDTAKITGHFEEEGLRVRKNGTQFWANVSITPMRNEFGDITGFSKITRDITERKKVEEELRQERDNLNALNEELTATQEELHQNVDELSRREKDLTVALAEKDVLLSEIHHRVKNNLTAFISLLSLEGSIDDSPAGKTLKLDLENRARSMALVHETLYRTNMYDEVDMGMYLTNLLDQVGNSFQTTRVIKTVVDAQGVMLDIPRATPAGLIINELVTNSFKYAFPESFDIQAIRNSPPTITIVLARTDGEYLLSVSDNGAGLPAGLDLAKTQSLGLKLVNFLAKHQMRAKVEINSTAGTEFVFRFSAKK